MVTTADCTKKYGMAANEAGMTLWDVPTELEIGVHLMECTFS